MALPGAMDSYYAHIADLGAGTPDAVIQTLSAPVTDLVGHANGYTDQILYNRSELKTNVIGFDGSHDTANYTVVSEWPLLETTNPHMVTDLVT